MKCQSFQIVSSTSMPVAAVSVVFVEAVVKEILIQDRLCSTAVSHLLKFDVKLSIRIQSNVRGLCIVY